MEKNTIWAIVLSTIVVIASFLLQPIIFGPQIEAAMQQQEIAAQEQKEKAEEENSVLIESEILQNDSEFVNAEIQENLKEEFVTITTDVVEVVFSNKGGDIISYKLLKHFDKDTGTGIQLADNVTETNRACALALGTADKKIINQIFEHEMIDENTILFKRNFVFEKNGKKEVVTLGKKYSFKPGEYMFKLDILVHGLENFTGFDYDGTAYTLRTSPQIGPHFDPKKDKYENRQFLAYNGKKTKKVILAQGQFKPYEKSFMWCGIAGKYFEELVIPNNPEIIKEGLYSSQIEVNDYANAQAFLERRAFTSADIQDTYYMYFGPRSEKYLKVYNVSDENAWNFGGRRVTESLQTSGFLSWLENILKWALEVIHKVVKNWGVAIIVLTIILKLLMFPLSKKQSLGTVKMQELQPRVQEIQKKYENDKQKQQMEMTKLYQEAGYNPASGCLPMIFQFLILFAMYNLFNNYFDFRGASFIPGWIPDLTVGDSVYQFKFNIPLLGNHLRLLPIIYTASQLLFGKITQYNGAQSNASMKFMTYGMPLIFFFLFYNAPAGLLLYWTVSNFFQMGQQIILNKMVAKKKAESKNNKTNVPVKKNNKR